MKRVAVLTAFVLVSMVAALAPPGTPIEAQGQCFPQTNFCITNPAFADYFRLRGDVKTLGYPISRSFTLDGFEVQFFQRVVLQLQGGQVQRLNVLDPGIMPMTRVNQSQFPPNDPQIAFYLARLIEQVRSIPADAIIVRQNWLRAYDFTTQAGALALSDYARANDPFAKVGKQQVAVEVSSIIRASPSSFRIAWIERRYQDGALASTERWSAILTVTVQPPRDADTLRKNPLGIYVNAINWSKELGQ